MAKYFRGDVVWTEYPSRDKDGNPTIKERPVVVLHNQNKNPDLITVYCTSQNDGDEKNCIFVEHQSENGQKMGITKDTYIRPSPNFIKTIKITAVLRKIGTCPLMNEIFKIIEDNQAR